MINALECDTFEKARQWQIEWEQEMKKEKDNHSRQTKPADKPSEMVRDNRETVEPTILDKTADTLNKGETGK